MKKHIGKWIVAALVLAITITACKSRKETAGQRVNPDPAHNSQNSVDWAGTYQGTLPCADCPGIHTTLTLDTNDTYTLTSSYLDRSDSLYSETGKFIWDDAGSRITLGNGGRRFQVGENRLIHLDAEGHEITGSLASQYVLQKMDGAIAGVHWTLIELNGKPITPASVQKEPYIRLVAENNRVEGTGGCNGFGGTHRFEAPNRVKFSRMIRTMMACENMEIENDFLKALETADSYYVTGDTLQLLRARMAPLAVFKASRF